MLRSALGYLAAADATAMAAETQAQCLRALEQLHAIETAARASVLGALASAAASARPGAPRARRGGFSPRAWLIRETGITAGAATGHAAWVRRAAAHPQVMPRRWPRGTCCPSRWPAPSAAGPTSSPRTAAWPRTRSSSWPRKPGRTCEGLAEVFGGIYTLSRPRPRLVPATQTAAIGAIAI